MGQEVGNTAAMVELFAWGERFLQIHEMGLPEEIGREVGVQCWNSRELGLCGFNLGEEWKGKGKEKDVKDLVFSPNIFLMVSDRESHLYYLFFLISAFGWSLNLLV